MDNKQCSQRSLQDEHLDFLIRMVYRREAERQLQQLIENIENRSSSEGYSAREEGFLQFLKKYDALSKSQHKATCIQRLKKWSSTLGKIAAALIIVMAIVTPVAVATVEPIRVKLMELLIDIQSEYTRLSLINTNSETVHIPEEWSGDYFPLYIPDDMEFKFIDAHATHFLLINNSGHRVEFWECTNNQIFQIDTENAHISYECIHESVCIVAEEDQLITLTWSNGHKYFVIFSSMSKEETLHIANSVSLINK